MVASGHGLLRIGSRPEKVIFPPVDDNASPTVDSTEESFRGWIEHVVGREGIG